ncbi:hypothetical protein [Dysgonomonas sp. HGC4]|uniref:hypothetical protein n=1 Tax=Dysgonomonas sp. HGC4 TaxID=1658009 RepID=UPI000682F485|nr:hypothetical protein [Dysgonomonas sp. HGC4]MBD8347190.1 hypothetical protein [Dysgonomonas sp. HGC4]
MIKAFLFIIAFLFLPFANQNKIQANSADSATSTKSSNDSRTLEVEQAGLSFYKWYLNATESRDIPFDAHIAKDKNGMCQLDSEPYFNELRKLGTISEKFIASERKRNSTCEEYVKKVHYKVFESGDAYTFDGICPQFAYMYWTSSQDTYQEVKAIQTIINKDDLSAHVDVVFIYTEGGEPPIISKTPHARVFLEREQGKWKTVKIERLDQDGQVVLQDEDGANIEDQSSLFASWSNDIVNFSISEKRITFKYHGQCVYYYPVQVVNKQEVILIWSNNMDCKFDNGTSQTFGLKEHPIIGKPFARYTLEAGVLYTEYFYKEWIEKYREEVNEDIFTDLYFYTSSDSE